MLAVRTGSRHNRVPDFLVQIEKLLLLRASVDQLQMSVLLANILKFLLKILLIVFLAFVDGVFNLAHKVRQVSKLNVQLEMALALAVQVGLESCKSFRVGQSRIRHKGDSLSSV